jgi:hypothetical protein
MLENLKLSVIFLYLGRSRFEFRPDIGCIYIYIYIYICLGFCIFPGKFQDNMALAGQTQLNSNAL